MIVLIALQIHATIHQRQHHHLNEPQQLLL
jgi:hypothetical protein